AELLPAAETSEAELGQPSKFTSALRRAMEIWATATISAESVRGRKAECAVQRSILSPGTAKLRRVQRTKQPKRSRGSGLPFASPLRRAQQKQGTATTRGKEFLSCAAGRNGFPLERGAFATRWRALAPGSDFFSVGQHQAEGQSQTGGQAGEVHPFLPGVGQAAGHSAYGIGWDAQREGDIAVGGAGLHPRFLAGDGPDDIHRMGGKAVHGVLVQRAVAGADSQQLYFKAAAL